MYYLHKWNLLQRKSSRRRFENENASAPHSDLLLISFLIPVIALSGVKSKAGRGSSWAYLWCVGWAMIPSLSNVDTKWFDAKCQSTRWFPMRQVLWQDQFDFACLPKPGCFEVHPWGFIRRVAMACSSREPWRKLAGQVQTFLYHVARSEKKLAGWLICWVAVAGNSCKPSSETAFVFKVYILRNQSGTQGGRSTCRMKADLAATLSR